MRDGGGIVLLIFVFFKINARTTAATAPGINTSTHIVVYLHFVRDIINIGMHNIPSLHRVAANSGHVPTRGLWRSQEDVNQIRILILRGCVGIMSQRPHPRSWVLENGQAPGMMPAAVSVACPLNTATLLLTGKSGRK